jgi:hypothetical protein
MAHALYCADDLKYMPIATGTNRLCAKCQAHNTGMVTGQKKGVPGRTLLIRMLDGHFNLGGRPTSPTDLSLRYFKKCGRNDSTPYGDCAPSLVAQKLYLF